MMKQVLLFTDLGIDDAFTILYILFRNDIKLVGIVADYGNVTREKAMWNINYLKYITGRQEIPVFLGASIPLTGIGIKTFPEVHGEAGLGPIIPPKINYPVYPLSHIHHMKNIDFTNVTVINLGRLSSLAIAFVLKIEEMENVKEYICMGGSFFYPGNVTAVAEANFYSDPYAANLVVQYAKNLTIIPLNVTQNAIVTPDMVNQIYEFHQITRDPAGLIIKPMLDYYYNFYSHSIPGIEGSPIHDFLTVWYLLHPNAVQLSKVPIKVIPDQGDGFGQSLVDLRAKPDANFKMHNVAFQFNYELFKNDIINTFLKKRFT
ncbi:nucleoside hydrolase (plasmid) [Arthrobacter citreus]|nr:nucleoside hydrolase [Arthrobacter citreus]